MIMQAYWGDFYQAFNSLRPENFTYEGLRHLWDHLESYEDELGEPIELDVIAFCCKYSEEDEETIRSENSLDKDEDVSEWLSDRTEVISEWEDDDGKRFLYRQF